MTLMHFACIQKDQCSKNILRLIPNFTTPIKCPIYPINANFAIVISDFEQKYVGCIVRNHVKLEVFSNVPYSQYKE